MVVNKFGTRLRADETPKNAQGSVSPSRFPPLRFSLRPLASEPAVGATRDLRVARSAGGLRGRSCPAPCAPAPRLAPALRRSALTRAKGLTQGRPDPPPPLRTARCGPQARTAPAQRFGPGAKPPCCGCGGEGVVPRGEGKQGRSSRLAYVAGGSDPALEERSGQPGSGFPERGQAVGPVEAGAGGERGLLCSHLGKKQRGQGS